MSTTMTMTLPPKNSIMSTAAAAAAAPTSTKLSTIDEPCCPNCGLSLPHPYSDPHAALLQAQRQIEDLQAQVRLLNQKATAAVDRWADYEDELSRLRAASTSTNNSTTAAAAAHARGNSNGNRPHTPDPSVSTSSPRSSFLGASASRISQLLSPRKSATNSNPNSTTTTTTAPIPTATAASVSAPALPLDPENRDRDRTNSITAKCTEPTTRDLASALAHERRLRLVAEEKLAATGREVEDLSASLFEQANSMVAAERRARAALEEQLSVLERRDLEKRERLERLEGAVRRIEHVRGVLEEERERRKEREMEKEREREREADGEMEKEETEDEHERRDEDGGDKDGYCYIHATNRSSKDGG